jgi:hypothetical protein
LSTFQAADELTETIVTYLSEQTRAFLAAKAPGVDAQPLLYLFDEIRRPLKFLSTDKRQRQYFASQKGFVMPETISFGLPRYEVSLYFRLKMCYIPIVVVYSFILLCFFLLSYLMPHFKYYQYF